MFQQYALYPWLTALENIEFGLEAKGVDKKTRREKKLCIICNWWDFLALKSIIRMNFQAA